MPTVRPSPETPLYHVTCEEAHGRCIFVASLANNPRIRFAAPTREEAVERLLNFLTKLEWYNEFGFA